MYIPVLQCISWQHCAHLGIKTTVVAANNFPSSDFTQKAFSVPRTGIKMSKTKQYSILCALVLLLWVDPISVTPNLTCWVQFKWHGLAGKPTAVTVLI